MTDVQPDSGPAAKGAHPVPSGGDGGRGCVLCGYTPEPGGEQQLRLLGTAPVTVAVCSDTSACLTRSVTATPPVTG